MASQLSQTRWATFIEFPPHNFPICVLCIFWWACNCFWDLVVFFLQWVLSHDCLCQHTHCCVITLTILNKCLNKKKWLLVDLICLSISPCLNCQNSMPWPTFSTCVQKLWSGKWNDQLDEWSKREVKSSLEDLKIPGELERPSSAESSFLMYFYMKMFVVGVIFYKCTAIQNLHTSMFCLIHCRKMKDPNMFTTRTSDPYFHNIWTWMTFWDEYF